MVLPAAAIGIVCGICAILFTILNLKVPRTWRALGPGAHPQDSCFASLEMEGCCSVRLDPLALSELASPWSPRQVARARQEFFKGKPAQWRMAEPCLLIVIFVTLGMMLPLFFPCTPTQVRLPDSALASV